MKIYRELGMRQATAWFLMQRIREGFVEGSPLSLPGPVEADETYIGGKRKNMRRKQRKELHGRGAVGKTAVIGAKDRATNWAPARSVQSTDAETLQGFIDEHARPEAHILTDDAKAYHGLPYVHETVNHSAGEYVRDKVIHTNGMESFWSLLKRGYHGTFHHLSEKHLDRYVAESAGRHNVREFDTTAQIRALARGMIGKRLTYRDLIA